ncbi:MAG: PRC-barrel domain containing protein [Ardenticatenaceae bacterium]|nr:PRC-barrel domain containing protein [Ardenticatenaceae bacterium]MCB9444621.1 PRC-barrel domain containing protein [Ardenticatenaceae bacterium]
MEFPLGVDVHCTDGLCGRSTYIILNPVTEQVTHLVVQEKQTPTFERLVSIKLVATTAAEIILLNCTREEFANLELFNQPDFIFTDIPQHATDPSLTMLWPYVVPVKRIIDDKIRRIPPGELAVRRGARVRATDGWVGRVDEFMVGPISGNITHLVLREGHPWKERDVTIPVGEIDHIEEKIVYLKVNKKTIAAMPSVPVKRRWK